MTIKFYKYQGTGNDFVIIDNRQEILNRSHTAIIQHLCDRKFGIGADGLMLLQNREGYDFEMVYFNADGNESTMCGNGGRCLVAFAKLMGVIEEKAHFLAIDGDHDATINTHNWVELKMMDVSSVESGADYYVLNTGSPHFIRFVDDVQAIDVFEAGRTIRYNDRFQKEGINVNFVESTKEGISVATYERGVEDETLSCGTGVTAAAIAYALYAPTKANNLVPIQTKGGNLAVRFQVKGSGFEEVWLCGPAVKVFEGEIEV